MFFVVRASITEMCGLRIADADPQIFGGGFADCWRMFGRREFANADLRESYSVLFSDKRRDRY